MTGHRYPLEVQPVIPEALLRLDELAGNLLYSWNRKVRGLFHQIDPELWEACQHNPKVFLRRVAQWRLDELAGDRNFLQDYREVLHGYDAYLEETAPYANIVEGIDAKRDLIAYFCMEYGLHESLRIYSGGLGVLAGDHCKAASDLGLPFVAMGLMYRQGYFDQTISREGVQQTHYRPADFRDLPVSRVTAEDGSILTVALPFPGRTVQVSAWRAEIGHVRLYLLDTDLEENEPADRTITYQLYGGGTGDRMAQDMVLGIGGTRMLRALGIKPSIWHINEGHGAFLILERCREAVQAGLDFDSALELVAAATVFTTHTPVPAGHDLFPRELMTSHFTTFVRDLGIPINKLLPLGASPENSQHFNMTALALRGSRHHNGVSRIHRGVASKMECYVWPQIDPEDNPITFVSNGVHVGTFLAREWANLFDARYQGWRNQLLNPAFWEESIAAIPDHRFWSLRQSLKSEMLESVRGILERQYRRNQHGRARLEVMHEALAPDKTRTLVLGFARRFATYKRALLLFQDPARLAALLNNPKRPVIVLFAGKAHPQDGPGQALIRQVNEFAAQPDFLGRVFFIEDYDLSLARKLVTGTDVWLNTPEYPLEASGSSGQKAAINGGLNLSVLDGWWAEGYNGENGWAIQPHGTDVDGGTRDRLEGSELLEILENEVIPCYFDRGPSGLSETWVRMSKNAMMSVLPRFSAHRMVTDYVRHLYVPAARISAELGTGNGVAARELATWKTAVRERWPGVQMRWLEAPPSAVNTNEPAHLRVAARLNELTPDDVRIECLLQTGDPRREEEDESVYAFHPEERIGEETVFALDLLPPENGLMHFRVHAFPWHAHLGHPLELGLRIWL
jgi:starch phosphorylase